MRKCQNWLKTYTAYTSQSESPDAYHIWCGLSTIAAAIRRQVWLNMGFFKIYPNMYIILVGPPGAKKGTAMGIATNLLEELDDIRISADAITREALIRAIKLAENNFDIGDQHYVQSPLTVISKEFSVFIGTGNNDLLALLTDLFDAHNKWEYRTKNSGIDTIRGVWLNLLGATTPEWLKTSIPLTAIGGGFTSRVLFIVAKGARSRNAIPSLSMEEQEMRADLVADLEHISLLKGEMDFDEQGRKWFVNWYENKEEALASDPRFAGYCERKHIHLLKTASILSIAESDTLIINETHLKTARILIEDLEETMLHAFGPVGRNILGPDIDMVLTYIQEHRVLSRQNLLKSIWRDVDPRNIQIVIQSLIDMKHIKTMFLNGVEVFAAYDYDAQKEGVKK